MVFFSPRLFGPLFNYDFPDVLFTSSCTHTVVGHLSFTLCFSCCFLTDAVHDHTWLILDLRLADDETNRVGGMCDFNDTETSDGDVDGNEAPGSFDKKSLDEMNEHIQVVLQQMRDKFQAMSEQILSKIDDMGTRIDDLEKNISDLMCHAGLEAPDK